MYLWARMPELPGQMAGDDMAFVKALIAEVCAATRTVACLGLLYLKYMHDGFSLLYY